LEWELRQHDLLGILKQTLSIFALLTTQLTCKLSNHLNFTHKHQNQSQTVAKLYGIKRIGHNHSPSNLELKSNKTSFIFSTKHHKILGKSTTLCLPIFHVKSTLKGHKIVKKCICKNFLGSLLKLSNEPGV
jgi:hypothetical protein